MPLTKLTSSSLSIDSIGSTNISGIANLSIANNTLASSKFAPYSIPPSAFVIYPENTPNSANSTPFTFNSNSNLSFSQDLNIVENRIINYYPGFPLYLSPNTLVGGRNSYMWVPGLYMDYTPSSDARFLRFRCDWGMSADRNYGSHAISHWYFFIAAEKQFAGISDQSYPGGGFRGIEVTRFTNADSDDHSKYYFERIVPSWGPYTARIGLMARRYSTSNQHQLYYNWWWEGNGYSLYQNTGGAGHTQTANLVIEELTNNSILQPSSNITFPTGMIATGGDNVYEVGDDRIHVFENSGTFNITQLGTDPSRGNKIWYTVVAGGGGGGMDMGGGGGGGGVIENQGATVLTGNCTVVVGAGGAGSPGPYNGPPATGSNGGDSFLYLTTPLSAGQTNVTSVDYLVVAGGGGGGMDMGGGGGGGGVLSGTLPVIAGQSYTVVVGAGGAGAPAGNTYQQNSSHQFNIAAGNGGNSQFATFTAIGGGRGGSSYYQYTPGAAGCAGGSGGGASGYSDGNTRDGGNGTAGQGFRGGRGGGQYYSGGGGGAGGQGVDSTARSDGGPGILNNITGDNYYWGGGGGGAGYSRESGNGGIGGGGGGSGGGLRGQGGGSAYNVGQPGGGDGTNTPGGDAGANTGGGGGGGTHYNVNNRGGFGGSGIVIVRYQGVQRAHGGDRIYQRVIGGVQYTIHEFLTPGTWQFINVNQEVIQARGGGGGQSGYYRSTGTSGERYLGPNPTRGGSGGGASANHSIVGIRYGGKNIAGQGTPGGASAGNVIDYCGGAGGGAGTSNPTTDQSALTFGRYDRSAGQGGSGYFTRIMGISKYFGGGGGGAGHSGVRVMGGPGGVGGGGGGTMYDDDYGTSAGGGGQGSYTDINLGSPAYNTIKWQMEGSGEAGYYSASTRGGNGLINSGGGGGGGSHSGSTGGNGSKGVVIIRYKFTNNKSSGLLGTINNPANNAREILAARPGVPSGDYYIWVDGEPTLLYCDMVNQGGGWMLAAVGRESLNTSSNAWFQNHGGGNYLTGLTQANLTATTSNFVPRYLPSGAIHALKGSNTWDKLEMVINRVQLNDSFYFRSPGSNYVFGWADFASITTERDQSVLNNPNNCGFSFNNPIGRSPDDGKEYPALPLTYTRYPNLWLGGTPVYTYNNLFWNDTIGNGVSNDANRMFTWNWSSHQGWTGFSAGASICTPGFQAGSECHSIQFVNIFVR